MRAGRCRCRCARRCSPGCRRAGPCRRLPARVRAGSGAGADDRRGGGSRAPRLPPARPPPPARRGPGSCCRAPPARHAGSPLAAASVRVVRLLAAAIDHRVSPGSTVCGDVCRRRGCDQLVTRRRRRSRALEFARRTSQSVGNSCSQRPLVRMPMPTQVLQHVLQRDRPTRGLPADGCSTTSLAQRAGNARTGQEASTAGRPRQGRRWSRDARHTGRKPTGRHAAAPGVAAPALAAVLFGAAALLAVQLAGCGRRRPRDPRHPRPGHAAGDQRRQPHLRRPLGGPDLCA